MSLIFFACTIFLSFIPLSPFLLHFLFMFLVSFIFEPSSCQLYSRLNAMFDFLYHVLDFVRMRIPHANFIIIIIHFLFLLLKSLVFNRLPLSYTRDAELPDLMRACSQLQS